MTFTEETLKDFLNQVPPENEIEWFDEERKARYIPYEIVVNKLNFLTNFTWGTKNFRHFFYTLPDSEVRVSGSVDVTIEYEYRKDDGTLCKVVRTLSGASSIYIKDYIDNPHWAASIKSLSVVNAVQVLGSAFGWGLNDNLRPKKEVKNKISNTIDQLTKKK